jgi:hypothetical protein
LSGTSSSIRTKLWWNSHWMVLFQNCVRQSRSPTKMATTVQLRCYWMQLWSRWVITCSWEPLVLKCPLYEAARVINLNQTVDVEGNDIDLLTLIYCWKITNFVFKHVLNFIWRSDIFLIDLFSWFWRRTHTPHVTLWSSTFFMYSVCFLY